MSGRIGAAPARDEDLLRVNLRNGLALGRSLGQGFVPPYGARLFLFEAYPPLTYRANLCRPHGAGSGTSDEECSWRVRRTEHPTVTGLALRAGLAAKLKSCPSPGKLKAYRLKAVPQDVTGQACGADEVTCSRIDRATDSER